MAQHILVIAGSGFIGRHVCRALTDQGCSVTVVHRGRTNPNLPGVRHLIGERGDLPQLLLDANTFDAAIDMFALTQSDAATAIAVLRERAARLILISSGDVYRRYDLLRRLESGSDDGGPLREDSPLRARLFPYRGQPGELGQAYHNYDKILVEREYANAGHPLAVLRLAMVFGPGDPQRRVQDYVRQLQSGKPITLAAAQATWCCPRIYVENAAAAITLAATSPDFAPGIYNIADEPALSEREWIAAIAAAAGTPFEINVESDAKNRSADALDFRHHLTMDSCRFRDTFGFTSPISLGDALERTLAPA